MFCPGCGSEERQMSQYCRSCGTDWRIVRVSLERPDSITASAVSAREEIGRAVADKIREVEDARDLKRVAEMSYHKSKSFWSPLTKNACAGYEPELLLLPAVWEPPYSA